MVVGHGAQRAGGLFSHVHCDTRAAKCQTIDLQNPNQAHRCHPHHPCPSALWSRSTISHLSIILFLLSVAQSVHDRERALSRQHEVAGWQDVTDPDCVVPTTKGTRNCGVIEGTGVYVMS